MFAKLTYFKFHDFGEKKYENENSNINGWRRLSRLNGAIKWVTKSALDSRMAANRSVSFEVVGLVEGWKGIVEVDPDDQKSCARYIKHLDEEIVRTWDRYGGTNLGTSRTNPFNPKNDRSEG